VEHELTADQTAFLEATRKFLDKSVPSERLRELRHDPAGFDGDYGRQGAVLGWTAALVSEDDGGGSVSGFGVSDLALVAFEFGRHAAPGPLIGANVVSDALSRLGSAGQKEQWLPGLLDGSLVASWAYGERRAGLLGAIDVTATPDGDGFVLRGEKAPVESAGQAAMFLVTAKRSDDELVQVIVPAQTSGVVVEPMESVDLTRRFGLVRFDDVALPATAVLGGADVAAEVERQLHIALVIQLAEIVGCLERAMDLTSEWLANRYSFGRPLASYQALKHRYADMRTWLEAGHAIADAAARHVQDDSERAVEFVSVGKSFLGSYGLEVLQECVQFHGGLGVTFEHDLHLYLRRAVLDAQLFGTVSDHRERLTSHLERTELAHA
jgi:alkylation response protein AidB-like acyl-CoA dehydrogenase